LLAGFGASTVSYLRERQARERAVIAEQREIDLRQQAELRARITQMTLLLSQENFQQADELLAETPAAQPNVEAAAVLRSVGEWHARQNRWEQAAERLNILLMINEFDGWDTVTLDYLGCGAVLVELDDKEPYYRFRRAAIARFIAVTHPFADRILKISLLLPVDKALIRSLTPLFEVTLETFKADSSEGREDTFRAAWQCISLALFEYRRGEYASAEEWSRRCLNYSEYNAPRIATARLLLAMSLQRLQQTDAARAELSLGRGLVEDKYRYALDHGGAVQGFWFDWEFARILLQEADGLIPPG
jgi:hypothetical protein